MKKILLLLVLLFSSFFPAQSWAQPATMPVNAPASTPTPADDASVPAAVIANPAAALTPIASELGQTLQTLVVGVPSKQAADVPEDNMSQMTDTFATTVSGTFSQIFETLKRDSTAFAADVSALPDLADWWNAQMSDPRRQILWQAIDSDLVIVIGAPLLASIAIALLLMPLRTNLRRKKPGQVWGQLGILLSLLTLRLIPVVLFMGVALFLLDRNEAHNLPRFIILNTVYALSAGYALRQILRSIFAPNTGHLRLLSFSTPQAIYACRWFSAFGILIIYGYFFMSIAAALRVPSGAINIFENVLALILTVMAITVIAQTRRRVAIMLRGDIDADHSTFGHSLRIWLARHWHHLAIAYLIIGLAVTVLGIDNSLSLMLRGTILTLVVLVLSRFSFTIIDRWTDTTVNNAALAHRQVLSFLMRPMLWLVALTGIAAVWGLHVAAVIATPFGHRATTAFVSIVLTLFILTAIYELIHLSIERHLGRRDKDNKAPVASARARTLLPMVRNSILILFSAITILNILSAFGMNIAPVLAGAGVLGVAIGFGSQTLVKDFLTGMFIVVENTVAVGDMVKIGDFFGTVEALSIRTIRLRDYDGALHILPFSEVSKITNMSKGFGYALVDIAVAYDSNLEHVMQVLRDIGAKLQEDPVFKRVILEPIEIMGVETLGDSSISIRARLRTRPGKQLDVRRLLLQRIKERFDIEKIVIPFPIITNIIKKGEV